MKWRQVNDWTWQRSCGRYTVTRSLHFEPGDSNGAWLYLASYKPTADAIAEVISEQPRATPERAIEDAAAHLRANQPNAATTHEAT